ncbi:MAG TPA: 3-phosphoshikimate 1-carboxyvinyltransferase [Rhodanobacteraceae bacterium]
MFLSVVGSQTRISGTADVPNSKYHAHRALILASLAEGTSRITGLSDARHVEYTIALLRTLGTQVSVDGNAFIVRGGPYHPKRNAITAGSSGSTLYFMLGLAALADHDLTVTGQKYFQRRPIGPLLKALRQMGIGVSSANDCPPIAVTAGRPEGGEVHIAGTLSQWISGLILLAPFATHPTTILVDGALNERNYIDLTIRMMHAFGLEVSASDDGLRYEIAPNQVPHAADISLPPDIGSAAFGVAVAAIHPADIVLRGLLHTRAAEVDHPEAAFLDIATAMGVPMQVDPAAGGVRIRHDGMRLKPVTVDCRDVPDMLPILATMASFADGESVFTHVEHVRLKESDRVTAMLQLNAMGGAVDFNGSELRIRGVPALHASDLSSFNDHRVLMSLAVAASAAEGQSTLTYPNAYRISYPRFLESMNGFGLDMRIDKRSIPGRARKSQRAAEQADAAVAAAAAITGDAWVRRWAKARPDAIALVEARPAATRHFTWAALDARIDRAAAVLLGLGVARRDRVAIQLPNWADFVVISVAAMRIGATVCPIMPIFRAYEVAFALQRSQARVFVVPEAFRGRHYAEEAAALLATPQRDAPIRVTDVLVIGNEPGHAHLPQDGGIHWHDWDAELAAAHVDATAIAARAPQPDDYAQLLFTSGTSGEPKGVLHKHATLSRAAAMEVRHLGLNDKDAIYIPSPLAHQTGFLYGMWLAFVLGVPQLVQAVWDAQRALTVLRGWKGSFVQAATPFLTDLVQAVEDGDEPAKSLRIFVATGAAVPRALAERATRVLGTKVCGAFGTTETCLGTLAAPTDEPVKVWGTDGRALDGIALRIVDGHGNALPPGQEGNFELKSDTMFGGYLDRPDLTHEAFTADGWYRTGDLATLDEAGFLRITGRVRDVINRGGEKIPVATIEEILYGHPAIAEVAIVAMPDERLGERGCAFVVLKPGSALTFGEMQHYLDGHEVSKHYWPERLEVIDALPRNAVGKIQKFKLREQAKGMVSQRTSQPRRQPSE